MLHDQSVLIVEDEIAIATDMSRSLAQAGYDVIGTAPDCEAALDLAENRPPNYAVVDLRLASPIDGVSVAEALARLHGTRIVFVTADPARLVQQGLHFASNVVAKPFRTTELLQVLAAQ